MRSRPGRRLRLHQDPLLETEAKAEATTRILRWAVRQGPELDFHPRDRLTERLPPGPPERQLLFRERTA